MSAKLSPEAVRTPFCAAFKLNTWAIVAILVSAAGRWCVANGNLNIAIRAVISLVPLVPTALYVRAIARWIRSQDELQRRIQQEAWLFATTGTVFVVTCLNMLGSSGIILGKHLAQGLGWEGSYALALFLWMLGCLISSRRYE